MVVKLLDAAEQIIKLYEKYGNIDLGIWDDDEDNDDDEITLYTDIDILYLPYQGKVVIE